MINTLNQTRDDLQNAADAIRSAQSRILDGANYGLLRATISGLLIGLDSQVAAVTAAILALSKNPDMMAPPAPEKV